MIRNRYEAKILINGKPATEVCHNDQTFIEGRGGSEFSIQFTNNTSTAVAVVPSVDGLNTIDGKPCSVKSDSYVVRAFRTITIPGWTVSSDDVAKFQFRSQKASTDSEKTYVEAIGEDGENQGWIALMVFPQKRPTGLMRGNPICTAWNSSHGYAGPPSGLSGEQLTASAVRSMVNNAPMMSSGDTFQYTDPNQRRVNVTPEESLGTGFGEREEYKVESVSFEYENPDKPAEVFSFFYDTLKNLKKMGVPVDLFKPSSKPSGNPFPGSPDILGSFCKVPKGWE